MSDVEALKQFNVIQKVNTLATGIAFIIWSLSILLKSLNAQKK
jgi:hypothetical protein